MSQDLPIPRQDTRSDGMAVLEWGSPEPAAPHRWTRSFGSVRRDPRLPAVLLALAAAAALASLVGEWLVVTVPNIGPQGSSLRVPAGVSEVGGFGTGYLIGLLALAGAVALTVAGTEPVRRNGRVLGLGLVLALLGLLVAAAVSLDDSTQRAYFANPDGGLRVEYGRGLAMAFVALASCGAAIWLREPPDRRAVPPQTVEGGASDGATDDAPGPDEGDQTGVGRRWGWRNRRQRGQTPDDQPAAPEGLTVEPAAPFVRPEPPAPR